MCYFDKDCRTNKVREKRTYEKIGGYVNLKEATVLCIVYRDCGFFFYVNKEFDNRRFPFLHLFKVLKFPYETELKIYLLTYYNYSYVLS